MTPQPRTLDELVEELDLDERQKDGLRSRWLEQMAWMSGRSARAKSWYYRLRVTAILGGILIPALVNVDLGESNAASVRYAVVVVGLLVAASAALEEFLRFGDKWRHYRETIEALKTEGWQYLQLVGAYGEGRRTHRQEYARFATRVEEILQRDVGVYITQVVAERRPDEEEAVAEVELAESREPEA